MLSKALAHYPQFRFREGQKRLWNPVLRQSFVPRPEEQVRLALVDYLTLEAGLSSSRISFESPVKLVGDRTSSRTDLICYNREMEVRLLVECKGPDIKLDEKAAVQVARYNQKVGAPLILVSNGTLDHWFSLDGQEVRLLKDLPEEFNSEEKPERDRTYWQKRAFLGSVQDGEQLDLAEQCMHLFGDPHQPVKYIKIEGMEPELALDHYYRIFGLDEQNRIGFSLSANARGESKLNVILNEAGANTAFMSCSLANLWKGTTDHALVRSAKGDQRIDLREIPGLNWTSDITEWVQPIGRRLLELS